MLARQRQDPEDATRREHALGLEEVRTHRPDGRPRFPRDVEEGERLGGRARGAIRVRDAMMTASRAQVLAQQLARARIEHADVQGVPLHGDPLTDPARGHAVVRGLDFDAAIEVHAARAVPIVAKGFERQRLQVRPLLGKHRAHLALRRAVDPRVGPARLPLIEVRLRRLDRLEALAA